ncbi:MAG TPA: RDD family protein [Methanoregulaceae archaeon]|nr:MAG: RDD family protein [Methanolinea sp.]HON81868.1 RDD family protein [Methanoregulaceae archaeon]HPD10626.1 RDD family protein [Methanoregulaceae archaeon]HRT15757.1 RDD family protein [Methanoregulaceae archaeon]HRU31271.1 RDD family protein [Methanoregulaceae archaeon]
MAFDEGDPAEWKRRGDSYVKAGKYEEAIQCYQYATYLDPRNASAWNNLGYVYSKLGRTDEARRVREKINEIKRQEITGTSGIPAHRENDAISFKSDVYFASPWDRWFAYIIDTILVVVVFFFLVLLLQAIYPHNQDSFIIILPVAMVTYWLYFAVLEAGENQATLGKRALRIFVTDDQGRRITFARSLGRSLLKIVDTITPFSLLTLLNGIAINYTAKSKGLHDYIAGTLVLTEKETSKKAFSGDTGNRSMSIWFIIILVIVAVIGLIIISAVLAAFVFGMAGSTSSSAISPEAIKYVPTGIKCGEGYCGAGSICCNGHCYEEPGPDYQIDYQTCMIYPKGTVLCGEEYCRGECCNGKCYEPCPPNYFRANDCNCYEQGGLMWEGPK